MKFASAVCSWGVIVMSTGTALAESSTPRSYPLPLGLSYLAMPALAVGAVAAFPDSNDGQGAALAVGVIVVGLAAPAVVHAANGQSMRAVVSPLATLGSTVGLGLVGLAVGALVADAECPSRASSWEEEDGCRLAPVLLSTYVGGFAGYAGWAIYDTIAHSSVERQTSPTITIAPKFTHASAGVDVVGTF